MSIVKVIEVLAEGKTIEAAMESAVKDASKTVRNIKSLYLELSDKLINEGAFFTRPYGPWADMVYRRAYSCTATLKTLKDNGMYTKITGLDEGIRKIQTCTG